MPPIVDPAPPEPSPVRLSPPTTARRRDAAADRRPYEPPALTLLITAGDLLDVLGPAQANYGGTGFA